MYKLQAPLTSVDALGKMSVLAVELVPSHWSCALVAFKSVHLPSSRSFDMPLKICRGQ